jgi:hypothetical protein
MSANAAFVTRLRHIVDTSVPSDERAVRAMALLDLHKARLYDQLGITPSCRPTVQAKTQAEDALDDLRLKVLKVEIDAPASSTEIYAGIRHRIEMTRRALAIRLTDNEERMDRVLLDIEFCPGCFRPDDRRWIDAVRDRLRDRHTVAASWEAIRDSRDLLARFDGHSDD